MTEAERKAFLEMLARKQVGWDYLESERRESLRNVVTKDAIGAFDYAFAYSQTLPPRLESGLVEFYAILGRATNQCSIS